MAGVDQCIRILHPVSGKLITTVFPPPQLPPTAAVAYWYR